MVPQAARATLVHRCGRSGSGGRCRACVQDVVRGWNAGLSDPALVERCDNSGAWAALPDVAACATPVGWAKAVGGAGGVAIGCYPIVTLKTAAEYDNEPGIKRLSGTAK